MMRDDAILCRCAVTRDMLLYARYDDDMTRQRARDAMPACARARKERLTALRDKRGEKIRERRAAMMMLCALARVTYLL